MMNCKIKVICILLFCAPVFTGSLFAVASPYEVFADSMVLQQGMNVSIAGTANSGEVVTVTLQGQTVSATASNSTWKVVLSTLTSGGPYTMTINTITWNSVYVGEVWVCSGQSNMGWGFTYKNWPGLQDWGGGGLPDTDKLAADCTNYNIRVCAERPYVTVDNPTFNIEKWDDSKPTWERVTPDLLLYPPSFSALGYLYARELYKTLKVPIGIIVAASGGACAECYVPKSVLLSNTTLYQPVLNYYNDTVFSTSPYNHPSSIPSRYYYAEICPIQPFTIRGVIWYQGESNAGDYYGIADRAFWYRYLMRDLITAWRDGWGQGDFPFIYVQIAGSNYINPTPTDSFGPRTRESQNWVEQNVNNTDMALCIDYSDEDTVHPLRKEPVAERMARIARGKIYGESIGYKTPTFNSMQITGNKVKVKFNNVGSGLIFKDLAYNTTNINTLMRGLLTNNNSFAVCGSDKKFYWAIPSIISNDTVELYSPFVSNPVNVRYAWADNPISCLFNSDGLPATLFRTDNYDRNFVGGLPLTSNIICSGTQGQVPADGSLISEITVSLLDSRGYPVVADNPANEGAASASTENWGIYPFQIASKGNDGIARTIEYTHVGNCWRSTGTVTVPQSWQVEWTTPRTFSKVKIFHSDPVIGYLKAFQCQYWNDTSAQFMDIPNAGVTNQGSGVLSNEFTFQPITTTKLMIYITDSSNGYAQLSEVMVNRIVNVSLVGGTNAMIVKQDLSLAKSVSIPTTFDFDGKVKVSVRAANIPGTITVRAASDGLTTGSSAITYLTDTTKPDKVIVYPNPFKKENENIFFLNINPQTDIKIYTITGELVKTIINSSNSDWVTWNGTNEQGDPVASGIYLYQTKTIKGINSNGKIAVIR